KHPLARHVAAGLAHDHEERALVPLGMLHADHRGFGHRRVGHGESLDVDGADPFAAGLDHVFRAVGDLHEAVGVDGGDVAGGEPAILHGIAAGVSEVAVDDPGAAHL